MFPKLKKFVSIRKNLKIRFIKILMFITVIGFGRARPTYSIKDAEAFNTGTTPARHRSPSDRRQPISIDKSKQKLCNNPDSPDDDSESESDPFQNRQEADDLLNTYFKLEKPDDDDSNGPDKPDSLLEQVDFDLFVKNLITERYGPIGGHFKTEFIRGEMYFYFEDSQIMTKILHSDCFDVEYEKYGYPKELAIDIKSMDIVAFVKKHYAKYNDKVLPSRGLVDAARTAYLDFCLDPNTIIKESDKAIKNQKGYIFYNPQTRKHITFNENKLYWTGFNLSATNYIRMINEGIIIE